MNFLANLEGIRDTFYIENDGDSSKDPLAWWVLGLKLGIEHVGLSSELGLVNWARVDVLVILLHVDGLGDTADDWNDRELLLWL